MQVWTVGEGLGIASEFSQTVCAVNNFRDHEVGSKEQATKLAAYTVHLFYLSGLS